jgi:PAS domain S-box-containing protein
LVNQSLRRIAPYAWALLVTAGAALVRSSLAPFLKDHYPLGTFYAAVALTGWFWGVRPAILAAILGYPVGIYLFLRSQTTPGYYGLELIAYPVICCAFIAFLYRLYERQYRLDQALAAHTSAQHALVESDERFKRYLDALPDIAFTWRPDGFQEYMSPRWFELVGDASGTDESFAAHVSPEDAAMLAERRREAVQRGEPMQAEFQLRDRHGSFRWFLTRSVPIRDMKGPILGWVGVLRDVDDEKHAREALELGEQRYRSVSDARDQASQRLEAATQAMSIGVAQCNRQLEYVWINPVYGRGIGLSPAHIEQIQGRRIKDVLGPADFERFEPYFKRVLGGETVEYEGPAGTSGDSSRWFRATYTPIWGKETAPVGWITVISDLTERRALEELLRDSNHRKDEFLATLAHELRNPLAPIRYATHLLKPGTPPEMAADARRMIDRQLAHMARLLDDLLDVSRITRGTLEIQRAALDMRVVLKQVVDAARPLADAAEQELRVELPDHPLPVLGDETRLIQVIGNIVGNAIKFTNAGGKIYLSASADGEMIVTRVRDTGQGISPELLAHVFDIFVQGDPNSHAQTGLGIGLSLAKQMIDLHGGRIEAHSEGPRRGSEFRVFLPRLAELPAMQESVVDTAKLSVLGADSIRLLVVDDNVDAADALTQFLKIAGYQALVAYDGRTAVEIAEILEPMVVLLDLGLPYLNGYEVARRIRALPWGRGARLIALTGWGQERDVQRSREFGFDEHLTKPVDPEVLLQRIIALTRGAAQTG